MFRTCLLLSVLAAAGCSPDRNAADAYADRNPALRASPLGHVYGMGYATDPMPFPLAATNQRAFVRSLAHDSLDVYRIEDVESGIQAPAQVLPVADHTFYGDIAASGDRLLTSTVLWEDRGGEYVELLDFAAIFPRADEVRPVAMLSPTEVVLGTPDTAFVFTQSGGSWTQSARLPVGPGSINLLYGEGDAIIAGTTVYRRAGAEWLETPTPVRMYRLSGTRFSSSEKLWDLDWQTGAWTEIGDRQGTQLTHVGETAVNGEDLEFTPFGGSRVTETAQDGFEWVGVTNGESSAVAIEKRPDGTHGLKWFRLVDRENLGSVMLDTDLRIEEGDFQTFEVQVPEHMQSLTVEISGDGDADLYVRQGADVGMRAYDCSPYRHGSIEVCTFTAPIGGTWSIGLHGYTDASVHLLTRVE